MSVAPIAPILQPVPDLPEPKVCQAQVPIWTSITPAEGKTDLKQKGAEVRVQIGMNVPVPKIPPNQWDPREGGPHHSIINKLRRDRVN